MNQTSNPLADQYTPNPSDEDLVRVAIDGAAALGFVLQRHQQWLSNVTVRMIYNREDAEDATQEVMLKIATGLGSFRAESSFRTWVYRIAANRVLDGKRSAAERPVMTSAAMLATSTTPQIRICAIPRAAPPRPGFSSRRPSLGI